MWTRIIPFVFVVLWATGFIFSKIVASDAEPFTFLVLRFGLTAAILGTVALLLKLDWPGRRAAMHATVAGALIHGVYLGPIFWAISRGMSSGIAALIVSTQPILTAMIVPRLIGERVGLRHWAGLMIGLAGVVLVLLPKFEAGTADADPVTVAASVIALLGITFGQIYQKRFATDLDLRTGGAWQFLGAFVLMALCALLFEDWRIRWTGELVFALAWLVFVMSIGAVTLLMIMIREGAISQVAACFFLVPPVTALMAYGLFGERLDGLQILGMALTSAGVLITGRASAAAVPKVALAKGTPAEGAPASVIDRTPHGR
ncbi:MAG: DMT family transporter [Hyphomicrobiaceae bacterium]